MARRSGDFREDSVVLIDADPAGDMDAWLAALVRDEPTTLPVMAAELVAEVRSEAE